MIGGYATGPSSVLAPPWLAGRSLASSVGPRTRGWTLRLLLLAVATGLVLMHHVVGAHQHAPGQPRGPNPAAHTASPTAAPALDATSGSTVDHHGAPALPGPAATTATLPAGSVSPATTPSPTLSTPAPEHSTPEHSTAAFLHVHHDRAGHDMAAMLHLCLAVLAAAVALAFALSLTWRRHDLDRARPATIPHRTRRGRPPLSVPLLLAQLQILRL